MTGNKKKEDKNKQIVGFLGVGLDNQDGHQRITQTENFVLLGGSKDTHERMQETAIKFNEALERRGKQLPQTTVDEVLELFGEAQE